jgi:RNA polymerase sigma-70 factor (ECF subfamily)
MEGRLRSCLTRFTRNRADTDELLQETYARLLSIEVDRLRQIRSVPGYALVAARRIALDWLKHKRALEIDLFPDGDVLIPEDGNAFTEDLVGCYQELEQLLDQVSGLPPRCSTVFTLRRMFGYSQREVGQLLDITVHTVEQHMLKATRTLRAASGPRQSSSMRYLLRRRKSRPMQIAARTELRVSRQAVSS